MKRSDSSKQSHKPVDPNAELDRMWGALRAADHAGSMPAVMAWLKRRGAGQTHRGRARAILHARPALVRIAAVCVVVAALAVACQIPVEQELREGYFVQWTVDGQPAGAVSRLPRYHWLDPSRLSISTAEGTNETTFLLWLPQADEENAAVLRDVLAADSANRAVALYPVGHTVRRPLYEAALGVIRIDIRGDSLTEDEVEEKIAAHLAAQGLTGYTIDYRKTGKESRIEITLPPDSL